MTTRFAGALLYGALLLLTTGAFAGEPIPGVDIELGKNPGGIIASGRTNKNGVFMVAGGVDAGNYFIDIGRIRRLLDEKGTAGITIKIDGQQQIIKTERGVMIDNQGSRQFFITTPIPSPRTTYSLGGEFGLLIGAGTRSFTITIQHTDGTLARTPSTTKRR